MTRVSSCSPSWTSSDPRLDGTATVWFTDYEYQGGLVVSSIWRIVENDQGIWRERPGLYVEFPGGPESDVFEVVMDGEGGYDGLVFVGVGDSHGSGVDLEGFIVEGEFPPPAEATSSE